MEILTIWYALKSTTYGSYPVFFESVELYRLVKEQDLDNTYSDSDFISINGSEGSNMFTTDVMDVSDFIDYLTHILEVIPEDETTKFYIEKAKALQQ